MYCKYYTQGFCRSCERLEQPYEQQLETKQQALKRLLLPFFLQSPTQDSLEGVPQLATHSIHQEPLLAPVASAQVGFRNKAKMVISGSVERPILGILPDPSDPLSAIDLCDCPLYPESFKRIFPILKLFIARAGLVPYNTASKRGELKYILLTESRYSQAMMLRFVLKSEKKRPLVERELMWLQAQLPPHSVISLNIQPTHAAVLEGEQEIFLTEAQTLTEYFNGIPLFIRPQGFFQTNPEMASRLYATAQEWTARLPVQHLWDLFCGVGGFGLHCAHALSLQQSESQSSICLTGIEISPSAIACARKSAQQLGLKNVQFSALDSTVFATGSAQNSLSNLPDLVIVNPPRRGLGKRLAAFLNQLRPTYLLYSSCNAQTMVEDVACLSGYRIVRVQLFDMFPHTSHYEVLSLLVCNSSESSQ